MIVILCGKSASGKDTTLKKLVEKYNYIPIISTTTRPIREGEKNGVNYNFISKEEFNWKIAKDMFLEYRSYNTLFNDIPDTWYYGTEKQELDPKKIYISVLDFDGAREVQKYYGRDNTIIIYISCPDVIRENRAKQRGSFDQTEWDRRLKDDEIKFSDDKVNELATMAFMSTYTVDELAANIDLLVSYAMNPVL